MRPSILVVYGQHCRLENISQTGHWVQSEKFSYAGKTVIREAGDKVPGSIMRTWRKLRQQHPQLFADSQILLWSQPAVAACLRCLLSLRIFLCSLAALSLNTLVKARPGLGLSQTGTWSDMVMAVWLLCTAHSYGSATGKASQTSGLAA